MSQSLTTIPDQPKERIVFEARPNLLPTILTFENMTLVGIVVLAAMLSMVFRIGAMELAIFAVLYLLVAFPSFMTIFSAGSTSYVLTNRRVVIFSFSFKQNEQSIPLSEIQSVSCKTSGLQYLYASGDVILIRKGLRKTIRLRAIRDHKHRAQQINQAIEAYRKTK